MELYKSITTNRWITGLTDEEAELVEEGDQDINKGQQANNLYDEPAENNIAVSNDSACDKQYDRPFGILISCLIIALIAIFWSVTWSAINDTFYRFVLE